MHNFYDKDALRIDCEIGADGACGMFSPARARDFLAAHPGDVNISISSPGGDVICASEIYTMLRAHKGAVTVLIDGIAASAASVVAMAADKIIMSPTAYMMIHRASTLTLGDKNEMDATKKMLSEIDDGIANAYSAKSGMSHERALKLMDDKAWLSARKALDLGLCDEIACTDAPDGAENVCALYSSVIYASGGKKKTLHAQEKQPDKKIDQAKAKALLAGA